MLLAGSSLADVLIVRVFVVVVMTYPLQLAGTEHQAALDLLQLFAYGTYGDVKGACPAA